LIGGRRRRRWSWRLCQEQMQKVSTQGVHQIRINSMRARAAVNFLMYFKTLSTKHFKQTAFAGFLSF